MRLGAEIRRFDEVTSTNEVLKKMAKGGALEGLVVVAHSQIAGRGRRGRTWWSPPEGNLYCSILLRPELRVDEIPALAPAAGLAVARALTGFGRVECGLKWPNDVRIGGKKVCGILAESIYTESGRAVILGIGVNVAPQDFPPDLAGIATSLENIPGWNVVQVEDVLQRILGELNRVYSRFLSGGFAVLVDEWNELHDLNGEPVRIDTGEKVVEGDALGIRADGALEVETNAGIEAVAAGEVE